MCVREWLRSVVCEPTAADPWLEDPAPELNEDAARLLTARVLPSGVRATEIVLEGTCPRCQHPTVSTHPVRSVAPIHAEAGKKRWLRRRTVRTKKRRVTSQCECAHVHPGRPEGEFGCGAPFALWVSWPTEGEAGSGRGATLEAATETRLLELHEDRELQRGAEEQLARVRKAAESWRTGLAGLLAVLTVVYFVKGKESFDDISPGCWRWLLGAILIAAAALAINGAYRALRAAYGLPRDEFVGRAAFRFARIPKRLRTTPDEIEAYGSVSAWRHAFAVQAVFDLWWAKASTVASLILVTAAAVITWVAPGPPPPAFAEAVYAKASDEEVVCGKVDRAVDGRFAIEAKNQRVHRFDFDELVSLRLVESCD